MSFHDRPFEFDKPDCKDCPPTTLDEEETIESIQKFINFYYRESFNRMLIRYNIFEYTFDESVDECCSANYILSKLRDAKSGGKLDFIGDEYNTIFGLTSEDLDFVTVGIAYTANLGGKTGMVGLGQLLRSDPDEPEKGIGIEATLIGHEIGHTRTLLHTKDCDDCLMKPSIGSKNSIEKAVIPQYQKDILDWRQNDPLRIVNIFNVEVDSVIWSREGLPPPPRLEPAKRGIRMSWRTNLEANQEVVFGTDPENLNLQGSPVATGGRSAVVPSIVHKSDLFAYETDEESNKDYVSLIGDKRYYYKITALSPDNPTKDTVTGSFIMPPQESDERIRPRTLADPETQLGKAQMTEEEFLRGDANEDGNVDITDAIYTLGILFQDKPLPICLDTADTNDDGGVDISDAVYLLNHLYAGGGPLPAPGQEYGFDPTVDDLRCNF